MEAAKLVDHAPIEIGVVFIHIIHNQVEVTSNRPRPQVEVPDVLDLLEKETFVHVRTRIVNTSQPPTSLFVPRTLTMMALLE
jgi:hypothetical protein